MRITVPVDDPDVDSTALLVEACGDARPGDTVLLDAIEGRIRAEGTWGLAGRTGIVIDGQDATVVRTATDPGLEAHVDVDRSESCGTHRLHVHGPHKAAGAHEGAFDRPRAAQHAFRARGAVDLAIIDCTARHVAGDAFHLGRLGRAAEHVWIDQSRGRSSGRHSFCCVAGAHITVTRSELGNAGRSAINLEVHPGWSVRDVNFGVPGRPDLGNIFTPSRLLWCAAEHSGELHDITIAHAVVCDTAELWVGQRGGGRSTGWRIEDVTATVASGNWRAATWRLTRTDLVVAGLTQPLQAGRGMAWIVAEDSTVTITQPHRTVGVRRDEDGRPILDGDLVAHVPGAATVAYRGDVRIGPA